jgi:enoyl-CoA hydratase/carnithine racemase
LTGAGGHFCAGADLRRTFAEDPTMMDRLDEYMDAFHELIRAIVRCPKPTIAQMDGAAVGFGADMALACDLRVASTTAYLQEKFVNIGLMPDGGGTFWLPRLVGTARAMKAMLLSEKLDAAQLDALGLLTGVVPPSELAAATMALAGRIERGPPLAFAALKSAVYASLGDLEAALGREREGQLRLLKSQDCIEGVMAWAQRRDPEFKGA